MRVGYFGGSFDPPHRGHLAVALAARDAFSLDRVLLAPTGRQPLKPEGATASFADRLRMTELLCAGEPGLEASPLDAPRPGGLPNYTADTLRTLRAGLAPGAELFAVVGADAFEGLPQWRGVPELLRLAAWIVVSRPGFIPSEPQALSLGGGEGVRVAVLTGVEDPTTATELRTRLEHGLPCEDLLPAGVLAYIRRHELYPAGTPRG